MTDGEALLAFCYDNPEDAAARLVYADWLEETGDADRAEFVRIHVALGRMWEDHPDAESLWERERELIETHGKRWLAAMPAFVHELRNSAEGYQPWVHFTAPALLEWGKARRRKRLEALWLDDLEGEQVAAVAASGLLTGVRSLSLSRARLRAEDAETLSRCPDLVSVKELCIRHIDLPSDAWRSLFHSPSLAGLKILDGTGCGPALGEALADSHVTCRLRRFGVGGQPGPLDIGTLSAAPAFSLIEELHLHYHPLSGEPFRRLVRSPAMRGLRFLHVAGCDLVDDDIRELADAPEVEALRILHLGSNQLTAVGAASLAASTHLAGLLSLEIGQNRIGDEGLARIASSRLTGLVSLDVFTTRISDVGLTALARSPLLGRLRTLKLYANGEVTAVGFAELCSSPGAARLEHLSCSATSLGPRAGESIGGSPHLGALRHLSLSRVGLGPAGTEALARSSGLGSLRQLDLYGNHIGEAGVEALLASPFLDQLRFLNLRPNGLKKEVRNRLRVAKGKRNWFF